MDILCLVRYTYPELAIFVITIPNIFVISIPIVVRVKSVQDTLNIRILSGGDSNSKYILMSNVRVTYQRYTRELA